MTDEKKKTMVIFDFDWSLMNEDSDRHIMNKLAPERRGTYQAGGSWTSFMASVMESVYQKGFKEKDIVEAFKDIRFEPEMQQALEHIRARGGNAMILSDANTLFIQHILDNYEISHLFDHVVTNEAEYDSSGMMNIYPYHGHGDRPAHACAIGCKSNLCKGTVLRDMDILRGEMFERRIYVGDGRNDFCPSTHLHDHDAVFVRKDKALHNLLETSEEERSKINASVHFWSDYPELLQLFQKHM
eukprot:Nk52_evm30s621 gene=Nk52_evmTU30s621